MQGEHSPSLLTAIWPLASLYLPSSHEAQVACPITLCALPGSHEVQFVWPVALWCLPEVHSVQLTDLLPAAYVPASHSAHWLCPDCDEPAPQRPAKRPRGF